MAFSAETYVLLNTKLKAVATGVKSVRVNTTDPTKLDFTLNDTNNTIITIQLPNSLSSQAIGICNKLSVDPVTNNLLYDGKAISGFTDNQVDLLNKFDVDSTGDLIWDGSPIAGLTQNEKDQLDALTNNIIVNENSITGNVENVEIGGMIFEPIKDPITSDVIGAKINGKEVLTGNDISTDGNTDNAVDDFFNGITL